MSLRDPTSPKRSPCTITAETGTPPIDGGSGQHWPVTVLVVDDEPGILNFLGRAMRRTQAL